MKMFYFYSTEYWEGGILPKIGQFGSTLISLYNPEVLNSVVFGVNMTHAHLRVDEVETTPIKYLITALREEMYTIVTGIWIGA